jgi:hypothetical protein
MDILKSLPEKYKRRLNCSDINVVRSFLELGVDPELFDLLTCTDPTCFELLIEHGYPINKLEDVDEIFLANGDISTETKCSIIKCLMSDQSLVDKYDLNHEIFRFAIYHECKPKKVCKYIIKNWPNVLMSAHYFYSSIEFASMVHPYANFTSKELVEEFIENPCYHSNEDAIKLFQYCDPIDLLTPKVFKKMSNNGLIELMKYLVGLGYNPTIEDIPKVFHDYTVASFDYLCELGVWDGNTFDWHAYAATLKRQPTIDENDITWFDKNGCPPELSQKWIKKRSPAPKPRSRRRDWDVVDDFSDF